MYLRDSLVAASLHPQEGVRNQDGAKPDRGKANQARLQIHRSLGKEGPELMIRQLLLLLLTLLTLALIILLLMMMMMMVMRREAKRVDVDLETKVLQVSSE